MPLQETATIFGVITFTTEDGEIPNSEALVEIIKERLHGILDEVTGLQCMEVDTLGVVDEALILHAELTAEAQQQQGPPPKTAEGYTQYYREEIGSVLSNFADDAFAKLPDTVVLPLEQSIELPDGRFVQVMCLEGNQQVFDRH